MGATTGDPSSDETGTVICIAAMPDGTFSIYQQGGPGDPSLQGGDDGSGDPSASGAPGAGASAGGGAPGGDGSDGSDGAQTANNVDDALQIAGQMLEAASGGDDGSGGTGAADGNAVMSPADAKAAWNQMAKSRDKKKAQGM